MIAVSNKRNPRQYTEPKMYIGQPKLVSEANNRELIFVTVQTDSLSDRQDEKQLEISEMKGNKIEQGVQKQAFASKSIKEKLQFLMNLP